MSVRDDFSLLQAVAQQRDKEAFAELYQRYEKRAFNLAARILRNPALAQDAVQEAMLAVWQSDPSVDPRNAEDWIMRIVLNKTMHLRRGEWRSAKRDERTREDSGAGRSANADDEAERNEVVALLRNQIDHLPELESTLLTCCYGGNMPHSDIAKLVNMPHRTVTYKIQQALQRLRSELAKAGIAAVVPVLSSSHLSEAVTTGRECPPDMMNVVMNRIGEHELTPRNLSRRAATARRGVWLWMGVGLALVAGVSCGAAWVLHGRNAVTPVAAAAEPLRSRTWNFDTPEQAKDFNVQEGAWHWLPKDGLNGSGCMENEPGSLFVAEVDFPVGNRPLEITVRSFAIQPEPADGYLYLISWSHFKWAARFHNIGQPSLLSKGATQWCQMRQYLTHDAIDMWANDRRTTFMAGEMTPGTKLTIVVRGQQRFDELTIREIPAEELPDVREFQAAVACIPPSQRVGTVELPGMKPARPGQPVTATFRTSGDNE